MTTAMTMNTAASAQDTCAAFACAAMNNCMIIILDAALLASIFVLLLDLITGKRTAVHRSYLPPFLKGQRQTDETRGSAVRRSLFF